MSSCDAPGFFGISVTWTVLKEIGNFIFLNVKFASRAISGPKTSLQFSRCSNRNNNNDNGNDDDDDDGWCYNSRLVTYELTVSIIQVRCFY